MIHINYEVRRHNLWTTANPGQSLEANTHSTTKRRITHTNLGHRISVVLVSLFFFVLIKKIPRSRSAVMILFFEILDKIVKTISNKWNDSMLYFKKNEVRRSSSIIFIIEKANQLNIWSRISFSKSSIDLPTIIWLFLDAVNLALF